MGMDSTKLRTENCKKFMEVEYLTTKMLKCPLELQIEKWDKEYALIQMRKSFGSLIAIMNEVLEARIGMYTTILKTNADIVDMLPWITEAEDIEAIRRVVTETTYIIAGQLDKLEGYTSPEA